MLSLHKLTNEQTGRVCGYNKDNIKSIVQRLKTENDIIINITHLFIALTVWYNNLHYNFAAVLFGYKHHQSICYAIDTIINQLTFYWVPSFIGYPYWTATKILSQVPQFVKDLYPNKKILGCIDATYLYQQHSNKNFQYQKATYSVHKHTNLQKEHVWCTTDGQVVVVDGPYRGHHDGVIGILSFVTLSMNHDVMELTHDGTEYSCFIEDIQVTIRQST